GILRLCLHKIFEPNFLAQMYGIANAELLKRYGKGTKNVRKRYQECTGKVLERYGKGTGKVLKRYWKGTDRLLCAVPEECIMMGGISTTDSLRPKRKKKAGRSKNGSICPLTDSLES